MALFPTYDAPRYKYGYQILILFGFLAIIGYALLYILQEKKKEAGTEEYEAEDGRRTEEHTT